MNDDTNEDSVGDEVLVRAARCSICRGTIPLANVALTRRDPAGSVIARACHHHFCRTRLRESLLLDSATSDYLN